MFRKKIQNAMNRPTRRSAATSAGGHQQQQHQQRSVVVVALGVIMLLCVWGLALMTSFQPQQQQQRQQQVAVIAAATPASAPKQQQALQDFRTQYHERYGGAADAILQKGVQRYGDIEMTARRMVQAATNQEAFQLSFAGYSVTVGRGNHLSESYPLVLQTLLDPLLRKTLGIPVSVSNAAIGGIPSFPYGFCFEHFLGAKADVISWDYSMNEGNGAAVLEAYLRQSQVQLPRRPMLIVLDTNTKRCNLLRAYADQRWIPEGLCVGMAKHAVPNLAYWTEEMANADRPAGFRDWDEFGAPPNCPGRGSWHPKRKEHELIAWMIAMYFVDALDVAVSLLRQDQEKMLTSRNTGTTSTLRQLQHQVPSFGEPLETPPADNDPAVTELLYGHVTNGPQHRSRTLKHLSCRTNFLPATDRERVLPSIVVAGLGSDAEADIMHVRSDDSYKSGWVLDVSSVERDTKVKVENCGGLGYIDMKIALYGIPESGPLLLWLPLEATALHQDHDHGTADDDMDASHWFDEIIICEANEKRSANACQLDRDVAYTVGGVAVAQPTMIRGAAEYLKRPTCVHVGVPRGARITRRGDVAALAAVASDKGGLSRSQRPTNHVGLMVQIVAQAPVTRANGACCISHVVWEQH